MAHINRSTGLFCIGGVVTGLDTVFSERENVL